MKQLLHCGALSLCATLSIGFHQLQAQNVGINITAPLERLDVNGNIYLRGDNLYTSHDAATNSNNDYMSYDDVNLLPLGGRGVFHFHADDARAATWDQPTSSISAQGAYFSGRVGIGTSAPQTLTHLSSTVDAILRIDADTDDVNEDDNPRVELYQDAGQTGAMIGFFDGTLNVGNTFRIGTRFANVDNWTTFTIEPQFQNIGIGTATPDQRLELAGGGMQINGEFGIGFNGDVPLNGNVNADRAKIYYDGDYIGTFNDFLVIEKTDLNDADPDGGIVFTMKGSDNVRENALIIRGNGRVGLQTILNPVYALELPNNGAAATGQGRANAWATYSDKRLKSDQKTLHYGLSTVMQLKPLAYQQHNSKQDTSGLLVIDAVSHPNIGFLAQDLQQLVPEAVHAPEDESKDLWAVDYTRLVPVLTKAIQEQQTTIQALKETNAKLEANQTALKAELEALKKKLP